MSGLRAVHSACRCCGVLLGLLLALGPMAQSVAAAQGPCGRAPMSEAPPAAGTAEDTTTGAQWTCPDPSVVSALRAVPLERPDGPLSGGGGLLLDADERPNHAAPQRMEAVPVRPLISPVLAALRPVVLQI